jgi:glyoxylase-like metal-dependent hydrolase (beta-lactamase superfamily II)
MRLLPANLRRVALTMLCLFGAADEVQAAEALAEAPSTVGATHVEPSATRILAPREKIDNLYVRNNAQEYVLQRLTAHTYWFQRQHYGTIFYVGKNGVLLFDPLAERGGFIKKAIASVTQLPVTAIVYSHDHADHIGDAASFTTDAGNLRIIASKATAEKMAFLNSSHPAPTEIVDWPRGSFSFEDLTVELHGFERAAHTDDHGAWLLTGEGVVHLPDLVNPDQPPFWAFAGSENFVYYEANLEQLAALDWTHLSGGHGNVGSRDDIAFYRSFLADLKGAVGKALGEVKWGTGVDAAAVNAHTAFLPAWLNAVSKHATDALRPKYGHFYGFESAVPRNAEMVAMTMFSYR